MFTTAFFLTFEKKKTLSKMTMIKTDGPARKDIADMASSLMLVGSKATTSLYLSLIHI